MKYSNMKLFREVVISVVTATTATLSLSATTLAAGFHSITWGSGLGKVRLH